MHYRTYIRIQESQTDQVILSDAEAYSTTSYDDSVSLMKLIAGNKDSFHILCVPPKIIKMKYAC